MRRLSPTHACLLLVVALLAGCSDRAPADSSAAGAQADTGFSWRHSTPEEQGIHSEAFVQALRRVREEQVDLHGLIVIRNGHIILECYVHPYDRDTLHNVKSVSKSVISALAGIAMREGVLEDLDQTVAEFFPQYFTDVEDPRKRQIALRHLLSMTSGIELDENGPIMYGIFASDDWIRATFALPMVDEPGQRFVYSTPLTHTVSGILTEASGQSLLEFARQHLFGPLAIERLQWARGPQGYYYGGSEVFLTPRDMAKFGLLYLQEGLWNDRQLIPVEWVRDSTRNQLSAGAGSRLYGYGWWPNDEGGYNAMGWGGQAIKVMPQLGMIAVGTAADPNASDVLFRGFEDYEPSNEPLPPNPEAVAELERLIEELAHPTAQEVPELPEMAQQISGQWYALDDNPRGIRELAFEFPGGSTAKILLETVSGPLDLAIGLDGVDRVSDAGTLGHMPQGNRVAQRGRWTGSETFVIDSNELGNPMHTRMEVVFRDDGIEITAAVRPIGIRTTFIGRKLERDGG